MLGLAKQRWVPLSSRQVNTADSVENGMFRAFKKQAFRGAVANILNNIVQVQRMGGHEPAQYKQNKFLLGFIPALVLHSFQHSGLNPSRDENIDMLNSVLPHALGACWQEFIIEWHANLQNEVVQRGSLAGANVALIAHSKLAPDVYDNDPDIREAKRLFSEGAFPHLGGNFNNSVSEILMIIYMTQARRHFES